MRPDWQELPNGDISHQAAGIHVSLNPRGEIALGRTVHQMLGEPKAVVILFDKVNNRIGLKPTALATRNCYPIHAAGRSGAKVIYCA